MKYFVSYTTIDKEITASLLANYSNFLKSKGDVYIDLLDNDSLDKQRRVFEELNKCDTLIIIESKNVYNSKWVELEIKQAIKLRKKIETISLKTIKKIIVDL
ncbi:TIR domain-containing protein [Flavobacterium chungbukense]|uniref:Thoeris protein ThsB TIR-like domain-containing protein n=1 Tax=Flavobacterium chungbukense TaxID=877464 RepID=A0ABP7YIX3_9FLAO|nr:TIR domain-containing protein [Flavobacterium chungbukense]MCC4920250.1 toll/interleukin-1 receptor domain-containing protein [Flavobacterium chungbukense]